MLRRALAAIALAACATVTAVLPAAPAQARACQIQHICIMTWYSDASRTVVVGEKFEDCGGDVSMWGVRTPYYTMTEDPC